MVGDINSDDIDHVSKDKAYIFQDSENIPPGSFRRGKSHGTILPSCSLRSPLRDVSAIARVNVMEESAVSGSPGLNLEDKMLGKAPPASSAEKSRQKKKVDEMYDQLGSEYESTKRATIGPASKLYSRREPDLLSNPPNMMDSRRDPIRKEMQRESKRRLNFTEIISVKVFDKDEKEQLYRVREVNGNDKAVLKRTEHFMSPRVSSACKRRPKKFFSEQKKAAKPSSSRAVSKTQFDLNSPTADDLNSDWDAPQEEYYTCKHESGIDSETHTPFYKCESSQYWKQLLIDEYIDFFNSYNKQQLVSIPHIGDVRANKIIGLRTKSRIKSLGDLEEIGLSDKIVRGILGAVAKRAFE